MKFFSVFIMIFYQNFLRSEKEKYNTPQLPQKTITEDEKKAIIRNNLITTFESYKKEGVMPLGAYDVLFKFIWGKITKYSEQDINTIKNEVSKYFNEGYELEKSQVKNVLELRQIIEKYKDINTKHSFKSECKKLYLRRYFNDLIDMNEHIKDYI